MPYDPELIAKLRAAKTTPKTGYNPELIAQLRAKKKSEPAELPSERFVKYAEPISMFGGALAKSGPIGAGLAGAATMGTEIAKQGIQAIGSEPGVPTTFVESGGRIAKAFARGAAGEGLARGIFGAIPIAQELVGPAVGKVLGKVKGGIAKTGAQLMKMTAGIPERTGEKVLQDVALLGRAKPIEEAGQAYAQALGKTGLRQGPEVAMETMGKSALSQEGATGFAFDALKKMDTGDLTYQEALVARDQLKNILKQPKWQNPSIAQNEKFLISMQSKLDDYLEPYFKLAGESFAAARKGYSEAMMKKDFSSLLPTNVNKTASVLRGLAGVGVAGSGYLTDNPVIGALGLLSMSPRMLGYGIRTTAVAAPVVSKLGTRLGTQALSEEVMPSSSEELMRKYNSKK